MLSTARKTEISQKQTSQYSRLQKLLAFKFFDKPSEDVASKTPSDDYIDIILEADFSNSGKVRNIK